MQLVLSRVPALVWRGVVNLLTPSLCLCCAAPVGAAASLCPACWAGLSLIEEPACEALGTPFAYAQGPGALSAAAVENPPAWDRARAAVLFDAQAGRLVHALKYRDRPEAGLLMARLMARAGRRLVADADVILPVPLHWLRLWQRRFNQSAFLAQRIAALSGRPWRHDVLIRTRRTRAQVGLDQQARRRNLHEAFTVPAARRAAVAGKSVLLVDDVRTTGATAEACAVALRRAGAAQVMLLTFALVPLPAKPHN